MKFIEEGKKEIDFYKKEAERLGISDEENKARI